MTRPITSGILLLILFFSAWRIFTLGLSDFYLSRALDGEIMAIDSALAWNKRNHKALYLKAKSATQKNSTQAVELLKTSLRYNPADMRTVAVLVGIADTPGPDADPDKLVQLATQLMPANKATRLRAASYWLKHGRLDKAIHEWSDALSIARDLENQLFPIFLRIAANDVARNQLSGIIDEPPVWWDSFFIYLSANLKNIDALIDIVERRHKSSGRLSDIESESLVRRFMSEERWSDAYLAWVESLDQSQRRLLGSVFDGGFEHPASGKGFGWRITNSSHFNTRFIRVYDSKGDRSLHLRFRGKEQAYSNLSQYLLLPSGRYKFSILKRSDLLSGRGRVKWYVRCAGDTDRVLGQSPAVIQNVKWSQLQFEFSVPDIKHCEAQLLRLETDGKRPFDHKLSGNIWFDAMTITKIPGAL